MAELRLSELHINSEAIITQLKQHTPYNLAKLLGLGLVPGALVKVHLVHPQIIVSIEQTLIGLDQAMADLVHVCQVKY